MVEGFAIDFIVAGASLAGELVTGQAPGIILAYGSALADRDGNDQDVGFRPLGQLAEQLAQQGVSSLRLDRRGVGRSSGDFGGPQQAVEDFMEILKQAQSLPELGEEPILLGYAEAAGLALLGAQKIRCRGLILIAPPATTMSDLLGYGSLCQSVLSAADPLEHSRLLTMIQTEYRQRKRLFLFRPVLQVTCPILLIHGAMDWVYPPVESEQIAEELAKAGKSCTLEILPDLDHWLVQTQHYRTSQENLSPGWQVDPRVAEMIAQWHRNNNLGL